MGVILLGLLAELDAQCAHAELATGLGKPAVGGQVLVAAFHPRADARAVTDAAEERAKKEAAAKLALRKRLSEERSREKSNAATLAKKNDPANQLRSTPIAQNNSQVPFNPLRSATKSKSSAAPLNPLRAQR